MRVLANKRRVPGHHPALPLVQAVHRVVQVHRGQDGLPPGNLHIHMMALEHEQGFSRITKVPIETSAHISIREFQKKEDQSKILRMKYMIINS